VRIGPKTEVLTEIIQYYRTIECLNLIGWRA